MLYAIILAGFAALVYFIKQTGRIGAENSQMKEVLDDISEANKIRADLDRDPAADERVREEFTR